LLSGKSSSAPSLVRHPSFAAPFLFFEILWGDADKIGKAGEDACCTSGLGLGVDAGGEGGCLWMFHKGIYIIRCVKMKPG
jgi:hypothetical protein